MSSFLSQTQIDSITGIFARHFDTFSAGRYLVVHKEPLKVVSSTTSPIYAGYSDSSNEENFTYVPVSGVFPVIQIYDKNNPGRINQSEIQTLASNVKTRIKVQRDAREFINNGRNERFEMDGLTFNAIGDETVQNYFGLVYYYFSLISTK